MVTIRRNGFRSWIMAAPRVVAFSAENRKSAFSGKCS